MKRLTGRWAHINVKLLHYAISASHNLQLDSSHEAWYVLAPKKHCRQTRALYNFFFASLPDKYFGTRSIKVPDSKPVQGPYGIWPGEPGLPIPSPDWDLTGILMGMKQGFERGPYGQALAHANPTQIPHGAHTGYEWAQLGNRTWFYRACACPG